MLKYIISCYLCYGDTFHCYLMEKINKWYEDNKYWDICVSEDKEMDGAGHNQNRLWSKYCFIKAKVQST